MLSVDGAALLTSVSGRFSPKIGIGLMVGEDRAEDDQLKLAGYSDEMILYQLAREDWARGNAGQHSALPATSTAASRICYGSASAGTPI